MLVLSRKLNERIVIGGNIEITVVQIRGGRIRLGINAPEHLSIRRQELVFDQGDFAEAETPASLELAAGAN